MTDALLIRIMRDMQTMRVIDGPSAPVPFAKLFGLVDMAMGAAQLRLRLLGMVLSGKVTWDAKRDAYAPVEGAQAR